MSDLRELTDANADSVLNGNQPVLLLISNGDGLRGDFSSAFKKAAQEKPEIVFARIDPQKNPRIAGLFDAGDKPMLVVWYCGQELVRRLKPWGSDVQLAVELLETTVKTYAPPQAAESVPSSMNEMLETMTAPAPILNAPVTVTDETFEQEVLNSDLPVLVDFWAAWCGPCRMVAPILDKLAKEFAGQIKIAKVDVDANPGLSQAFRIQSIPNLMIVKQRTMIFNQPGALPEAALRSLIEQTIALEIPPQTQPAK